MTKKKEPKIVQWTPECDYAFNKFKECLTSAPILATPDFTKPFLLQTDASKTGIGAVLSQIQGENKEEHPIIFLSKKMLPSEMNYSVSEQECLAIVWSITVVTDHKALTWLSNTRHTNNRLMRWSMTLQQFEYRKCITNTNTDSLSRMYY